MPQRDDLFRAGLLALAEERFVDAAEWMRRAIAIDPVEDANLTIPTPGATPAPYLPHHYLAVALASMGNCDDARQAWEISLEQGAMQRSAGFEQFVAFRRRCDGSFAQASPAGPPDPPGGSPPVATPDGNPEWQRAEGELAAAAAAARQVEQSSDVASARSRDERFRSDLQRAEALLAQARRALADAQDRGDPAAYERAADLAAAARSRLGTLLRQARSITVQSAGAEPLTPGDAAGAPFPPLAQLPSDAGPPMLPPDVPSPTGGLPEAHAAASYVIPLQWLFLGTGVLLLFAMLIVAVQVPHPTGFQHVVFRTTLSLAATCVAASIPWLTGTGGGVQRAGSAGGAIAVFLIVYFFDPMKRVARPDAGAGIAAAAAIPESCIFICYRRADSEDVVGRLHSALVQQFGDPAVFKDVDDIPLGADYREVLEAAVGSCKVILPVIGPVWDDVRNDAGQRRIDDPADYVRIEIATALQRKIPIIPVLVRRPALPPIDRLPPELRDLAYRQAIQLRPDPDFDHDVSRLVTNLNRLLAVRERQAT